MNHRTLLLTLVLAGAAVADDSLLTLDRIFDSTELDVAETPQPRWLDDGSGWLELVENDIVLRDPETGDAETLVAGERLIDPQSNEPIGIERFRWSEDRKRFLIAQKDDAGTWTLDIPKWNLRRLGEGLGAVSGEQLSPDGRLAAYVAGPDLYVEDLSTGKTKRLTKTGSESIVNATAEGVYQGPERGGLSLESGQPANRLCPIRYRGNEKLHADQLHGRSLPTDARVPPCEAGSEAALRASGRRQRLRRKDNLARDPR